MIPTLPATTIRTPVRIVRAEYPALDRVLVAEDHQPTREALRTLLELKGFQVTAVGDGSDAIECLSDPDGPAIGIIDWMMPGASGVEVCRAVRAAVPARYVYLIMVTARDREEDVAEALAVGADDFIRKPCGPTELVARVRCGRRTIELKHWWSAFASSSGCCRSACIAKRSATTPTTGRRSKPTFTRKRERTFPTASVRTACRTHCAAWTSQPSRRGLRSDQTDLLL
jgi:DNA-binding response OmpR family regulator